MSIKKLAAVEFQPQNVADLAKIRRVVDEGIAAHLPTLRIAVQLGEKAKGDLAKIALNLEEMRQLENVRDALAGAAKLFGGLGTFVDSVAARLTIASAHAACDHPPKI